METLAELLAPDFVDHSMLPGQVPEREGYIRKIAEERAAFPTYVASSRTRQPTDDTVITRLS